MSTAKEEILKRIRTAQKQAGLSDHVEAPREYDTEGTLNADELRDMLVERLEDYKAEVHVTTEAELAETISQIFTNKECSKVTYAQGMDAALIAVSYTHLTLPTIYSV